MSEKRMKSYRYLAPGGSQPYVFYAETEKKADGYAKDWGVKHGVELVKFK